MCGLCIQTFENGRMLNILHTSTKKDVGTFVSVEDFMFSMPVRKKRINEVFDLEELKTQLKYLSLIHHKVNIHSKFNIKIFNL